MTTSNKKFMKIGNYEFELKKFKHLESRSEETNCFEAVLYVNGKKLADCGNAGQGGSTDVYYLPESIKLGKEVEDFLKTQPKIDLAGYNFQLDLTLEFIVDELVQECLKAQYIRKIKNLARKHLVFKNLKGNYVTIKWKKHTIESLLTTPQGRELLKQTIAKEAAKGNVLFNENIPPELLPK